jgi:ssDNA-binding Zn-finger/Zn-ribbon topoisomerase 1
MTQGQSVPEPRRCPRCGGPMYKPAGSTLYWHADNNHPRCTITNLVDAPVVIPSVEEPPGETPKNSRRKK